MPVHPGCDCQTVPVTVSLTLPVGCSLSLRLPVTVPVPASVADRGIMTGGDVNYYYLQSRCQWVDGMSTGRRRHLVTLLFKLCVWRRRAEAASDSEGLSTPGR